MYERMLDKQKNPTFEELIDYSGQSGELWIKLDKYMRDVFSAQRLIRFPYGNKYGWSAKYSLKNKHICDIFAEQNAFSAHFRIGNSALGTVYDILSDYSKEICDNKYPCGDGGWLNYRVLCDEHLQDIIKIIHSKIGLPKAE